MGYNMGPLHDIIELATGDLTAEELAAQKSMMLEDAEALWKALQEDPLEFGKQLGKGLLDWDTWADDPARAIGHLVPDIVAGVLSGGTATAATRGIKGGADALDALSDMTKGLRGLDNLDGLGDVGKIDNAIDDLGDLGKLDDLHTGGHVGPRDPFRREMWADDAYDEIRGSTDDAAKISADETNLQMPDGSQLSADDVLSVKDHVFHQEHRITYGDGETVVKRFDSSPEQAEAWFRLQNGQATDADRLWLLHEKTELEYLKANPGASYNEAHRAANEVANWEREVGLK